MATFAPSAARRLAIAAPIPREPPVTSAIFPSSFLDIFYLLFLQSRSLRLLYGSDHGPTTFCEQPSLECLFGYPIKVGRNTTIEGERRILAITDVNTLSSEKPRVKGPDARSKHCKSCTYDRQHYASSQIVGSRKARP